MQRQTSARCFAACLGTPLLLASRAAATLPPSAAAAFTERGGVRVRAGCSCPCARGPRRALLCQRRPQSTAAEKRFHCSVCKKAFRLEMAAKVHIQQAHNGEGSVETGAGPGQPGTTTETGSLVPPPNAPPQGPTIVEEVVQPVDRPLRRRSRPTPKPLHEPYRDMPAGALEEMLGVWDSVGVKRLQGTFVHSSMIMKVFAAKPDAGSEPLYDPMEPEGENPFAHSAAHSVTAAPAVADEEEHNIYDIDLNDAFAIATGENHGPFRVARCENPFMAATHGAAPGAGARLRVLTQANAPAGPATPATASDAAPQTAPVTPYGQLPVFGQAPAPAAAATAAAGTTGVVASPFATSVTDSPFAQPVSSPFVASPFAAVSPQALEPATAASSPFAAASVLGEAAASPFTAPSADSPFAAAATPSPFTASPFLGGALGAGVAEHAAFSAPASFPPYQVADGGVGTPFPGAGLGVTEPVAAEPKHECATCGKEFASYEGMRMHAKAKHGIELPLPTKEKARRPRPVPELPAYIPSPVDLSMTTPFGKATSDASWSETEIVPHAVSVSNITVAGKVIDVETVDPSTAQITVFVPGEQKEDSETLTVRWTRSNPSLPLDVARDDTVFVSGTLRLLPVYEPLVDKYYSSPIIFAACPTGLVQKLR